MELPKSTGHAGQEEKLAASEIFKALWRECTSDEAYLKLKGEWQKEKKEWLKAGGKVQKDDGIWKGYEHDGGEKGRREGREGHRQYKRENKNRVIS